MDDRTLRTDTNQVLHLTKSFASKYGFYLAGGTALALYWQHRESEDLDYFTDSDFSGNDLLKELMLEIPLDSFTPYRRTLNCYIGKVKVQFLYQIPGPIFPLKTYKEVVIADIKDIIPMKMLAIADRGAKKDFIDLYMALKTFTMTEILRLTDERYGVGKLNLTHILKAAIYFKDAEQQAMPKMFINDRWETMKQVIQNEVEKAMRYF